MWRIKELNLKTVLGIVLFAGLMTWLLFRVSAATPFASLEPESASLSSGATVASDPSATSGSFIEFNTASTGGGSLDTIYISAKELTAIKAKITKGEQPWTSAYTRLISDANSALGGSLVSIADNGGGTTAGAHYFATDAPYKTDGVYDPDADREDYSKAFRLGKDLPALGLAYRLTGDSKYADKALQLIRKWAIDPAAYMEPIAKNSGPSTAGHKSGGVIEIFITMPGLIYGADLIWEYDGWTDSERAAFTKWARDLGNDAKNRETFTNNFDNWRVDLIAAAGEFTGDSTLLSYAWQRFRSNVDNQMDSSGRMIKEVDRTRSLHYSLYALNAMFQTAEIARQNGVDLYNYSVNGKSIQKAADFHAPYLINPSSWPYEEIGNLTSGEEAPMYELAYSMWQKPSYLNVINKFGRPITSIRNIGPVTLTHGNLFQLAL